MKPKFKHHAQAIADMLMHQLEALQPCGNADLWWFVKEQTVLRDFNDPEKLVEVTREKFDQVLSILIEKGMVKGDDDEGYWAVYYDRQVQGPDGFYHNDRITAWDFHTKAEDSNFAVYRIFSEFRNY